MEKTCLFVRAAVRPNMPNMPKSASAERRAAVDMDLCIGGRACCRRAVQQSIDIACLRGPQQQTRCGCGA